MDVLILILILQVLLLRIIYRYYIGVKSCKLNIIDLTLRNEDLMVKNDNLLEDRNRIFSGILPIANSEKELCLYCVNRDKCKEVSIKDL